MSAPGDQISTHAAGASGPVGRPSSWTAHRRPSRRASISAVARAAHPVELQVETMSSVSTRAFLYTWYAVLIIALVVESNVGLQWVSRNFCGDATVSAYHLEDWNSTACLSWEAYWIRPRDGQRRYCTVGDARDCEAGDADAVLQWRSDHVVGGSADALVVPLPVRGVIAEDEADGLALRTGGSDEGRNRGCPPSTGLPITTTGSTESLRSRRSAPRGLHSERKAPTATMTTTASFSTPAPRPTMPPLHRVYKLRWTAEALSGVMDRELNRFLHVFISLASPLFHPPAPSARRGTSGGASDPPPPLWKTYEVLVALEETSVAPLNMSGARIDVRDGNSATTSGMPRAPLFSFFFASSSSSSASSSLPPTSSSSSDGNGSKYIYTYRESVTCWRTALRCSNIVLPSSVVIPTNRSRLTITLIDVDAELAEATVRASAAAFTAATNRGGFGAFAACGNTDLSGASLIARVRRAVQSVLRAPSTPTTGVGVMYQRAKYTIGIIVVRYLSLFIVLVGALRFLHRSRQADQMLYEQKWTLALQLGLILYLNPLYWWCIYAAEKARGGSKHMMEGVDNAGMTSDAFSQERGFTPMSLWHLALYYVEFHVPTYFVALTVCYVWGVIAGSFRWSLAATEASSQRAAATAASASPACPSSAAPSADVHAPLRDTSTDEHSAQVTVPLTVTVSGSQPARRRVHVLMVLYVLAVASLDTIKCCLEEDGPTGGWSEVSCRTTRCLAVQRATLYVLVGGILSSGVGLYWLRRNLARHPYLSTRPQQLACRIMIFVYFTGGLYCAVQALLLETLYAHLIAIIYYQPLVQLSHLLVLTSFVAHMTYVYTTTQSSLQIPLRPSDPRWKTVGWSSRWYRWLDWHGGSLYVFFNEEEERRFFEVQVAYQLAKRERKEQRKRSNKERKATRDEAQQQPDQDRVSLLRGSGGALEDEFDPTNTADEHGRCAACQSHGCFLSRFSDAQGGAERGAPTPRCFPDDSCTTASARGNATPSAPPLFSIPTNTPSALPEPAETDWLQWPQGRLPERRRSLSTATQPSSNSTESNGLHDHPNHGKEEEEEWKSEEDDRVAPSEEGRVGSVHEGVGAGRQPPSSAPAEASPFSLGVTPGTTRRDANSGGGGVDHHSSNRETSAKERVPSHRVLSRVSSRVLDALHSAESRLVDGTATFVDLLAEKCVDRPLQVLLRQRARQRFVFFNLETAIDCLNLSREAYAVQESRGDDLIRTGIQVDAGEVPRAALTLMERAAVALFGLCFNKSPLEPPAVQEAVVVVDDDDGGAGGVASAERAPLLNRQPAALSETACTPNTDRSWLPSLASLKKGGDTDTASPTRSVEAAERYATPTGRQPRGSPRAAATRASTSVPRSAQPPQPPLLLMPPMDIEKYGYRPVAVFDTRGVQVVVARMDVSGACPVHTGKYPRLTIAFRGTDNVANVLVDIRFRQRTWKEMETPTLLPRATVHSGFLELWMSLKEAVMDVVLRELRSQPAGSREDEQGNEPMADAAEAGAPPAGADAGRSDTLRGAAPFSPHWSVPASRRDQERGRSGFLRIYVTGHSLGGALACLCAYSLRRMLLLIQYPEPDVAVYTFGQPRIGNSVFKQHYNHAVPRTFRVVNESDVVSGFNVLGGHHVGVQVNVDRHGNYICKPMYIERLLRPTRGRGLALLNHKLAAYANSLNAVADVYAGGACPVRCLESYMEDIVSVSSSEVDEGDAEETLQAARLPQREEVEEEEDRAAA
ncbi:hypothetical protein ABB37_04707 [Leptomonas pyrrhocoris]|uniref:Fungal lipase-type domain-containing protein n=1 Tax=Leptomonas pyrrhocoris TaxID=157538 RepID=A0A0M9G1W5_LEPPY|nr:hypothetical protein ABB37_04707 [Leptomonas pyrrhocoris]KPA80489.1 hypothetical protein ABB37_04707 [Leptomonas pyrrhocoris]|eukprot:XP_015658928.1 hypothetical protein ABB37_04707 [Leptomonas pyrrhocoris]